ncbi:hypothetical protein BDK51DRAFT_33540 [Blyttiomyces helicus]|uniref:Cytochrome P450 n=1 Tax=Blyttiomyces helicus TaxID=388810 RepID=A0A4P9W914_9FUNG|nr:hypothetical protein BDK51DRAFT_33540 [Blyttiomyces helicus]|eukprot:RKO87280.1 hypothetical protein BDK51DRAFT_33540 [Blyttiomyces helicus]
MPLLTRNLEKPSYLMFGKGWNVAEEPMRRLHGDIVLFPANAQKTADGDEKRNGSQEIDRWDAVKSLLQIGAWHVNSEPAQPDWSRASPASAHPTMRTDLGCHREVRARESAAERNSGEGNAATQAKPRLMSFPVTNAGGEQIMSPSFGAAIVLGTGRGVLRDIVLRSATGRKKREIPGEPAHWLLGHVTVLAKHQMATDRDHPDYLFLEWAKKYGPIFFLQVPFQPLIVLEPAVTDPEEIRRVLVTENWPK